MSLGCRMGGDPDNTVMSLGAKWEDMVTLLALTWLPLLECNLPWPLLPPFMPTGKLEHEHDSLARKVGQSASAASHNTKEMQWRLTTCSRNCNFVQAAKTTQPGCSPVPCTAQLGGIAMNKLGLMVPTFGRQGWALHRRPLGQVLGTNLIRSFTAMSCHYWNGAKIPIGF